MKNFNVTLTRAHKIVERIRSKLSELEKEIGFVLPTIQITGYAGEHQMAETKVLVNNALASQVKHKELLDIMTEIRTKVGAANVESGVSHLLAEQEGLSRRIALMKSILAKPSNAISLDALPDYKPFGEQNSFARVTGIQVSTLPTEISNDLATELTKLQTQAFALSDKMADANASRISLELPDNIAEVLGLV